MIVQETKLGPIGEALIAGRIRAQARRLRELEAGKATASPPDPLAALDRREKARAERHMGSVVRRLHRQGKLTDRQLDALETWAADHAAATVGVRSQLGRDGAGGGNAAAVEVDAKIARIVAQGRFNTARAALYVGAGLQAGAVTEAVACRNASLTAAAGEGGRSNGRATCEAGEMLRTGADVLDLHYRGRGAR
jgi:hypothetical protein